MTENGIEKQVITFMQSRGWRATRNHVGVFKTQYGGTISIGIKHFPDWTFTRGNLAFSGQADLIHFEAKAPGKRPNNGQLEKLASLNHLGELAIWASSLEMFKLQYLGSFPDDAKD